MTTDPPVPLAADAVGHGPGVAALAHLGEPGSRSRVPTPALVCDVDLLVGNLDRMAGLAGAAGVALRPHAKTHKSAWVARLQLGRGAAGVACAKLGEAEVLVDRLAQDHPEGDGHTGRVPVLITSPLAGPATAARARALAGRCDLAVVVDHPDGADELASAEGDAPLTVLCDVDPGLGRTGVSGPGEARAVVDRVVAAPGLRFGGLQCYGGHLQHVPGRRERLAATRAAAARLEAVVSALGADGHRIPLRTGGGTGTALIDMELGWLDELQPGSYVYMDREYRDALGDDPEGAFGQSLTIETTVISVNQGSFVTVDAGLKAMATDAGPAAVVGTGGRTYGFFGDEHGLVTDGGASRLRRGDRLALVPPHCDPTVDRYDLLWLVRGDILVGVTPVDARGRSQ